MRLRLHSALRGESRTIPTDGSGAGRTGYGIGVTPSLDHTRCLPPAPLAYHLLLPARRVIPLSRPPSVLAEIVLLPDCHPRASVENQSIAESRRHNLRLCGRRDGPGGGCHGGNAHVLKLGPSRRCRLRAMRGLRGSGGSRRARPTASISPFCFTGGANVNSDMTLPRGWLERALESCCAPALPRWSAPPKLGLRRVVRTVRRSVRWSQDGPSSAAK